jgi:hypothetical protein
MCLCHVGYDPKISLKGMRKDVLVKRNFKKIRNFNDKKCVHSYYITQNMHILTVATSNNICT